MVNNEKMIIEAIRGYEGGLGGSLTDKQKNEIIRGPQNKPENLEPVNKEQFHEGFKTAMKNHPVEWFLE